MRVQKRGRCWQSTQTWSTTCLQHNGMLCFPSFASPCLVLVVVEHMIRDVGLHFTCERSHMLDLCQRHLSLSLSPFLPLLFFARTALHSFGGSDCSNHWHNHKPRKINDKTPDSSAALSLRAFPIWRRAFFLSFFFR